MVFIAPACSRVLYRRPLFRQSVRLSTFMSTFDIYVKVSIPVNYKTKQPLNFAWNISLTSWLRHRLPLFHSSVRSSVRLSTFMSKFNIYVEVSILINYKTKQPSNLAWNISLTLWHTCPLFHSSVRSSVRLLIVLLCWSSSFTSKLVF